MCVCLFVCFWFLFFNYKLIYVETLSFVHPNWTVYLGQSASQRYVYVPTLRSHIRWRCCSHHASQLTSLFIPILTLPDTSVIRVDPSTYPNPTSITLLDLNNSAVAFANGVTAYDGKLYVPKQQTDSGVAIVDAVTFTEIGFVLYNGTCPASVASSGGNINQHYGVAYILVLLKLPPTGGSPGSMDPSPSERLS